MKRLSAIVLLFPVLTLAQRQDEQQIRQVIKDQQVCWNAGDLDCFMESYWKSDKLVFIGSRGVTYGWQNTLDNYKKSYPTKELMGKLTLELLILEPLSEDFWSVVGRWELQREKDNPQGHFSLIFRRLGNDWVIVSDHSS